MNSFIQILYLQSQYIIKMMMSSLRGTLTLHRVNKVGLNNNADIGGGHIRQKILSLLFRKIKRERSPRNKTLMALSDR